MGASVVLIHGGCGGIVEWTDTSDLDEDYVCEMCGAVVDGAEIETAYRRMSAQPLSSREERILDAVEEWHSAPEGECVGPLNEHLGWSREEYARHVLDPSWLPPEREGAV